jgi:hypothetical protein
VGRFRVAIVGVRVLESRNPKRSAPTTGAIRGASFYCIASGQLDALGDVSIFRAPLDRPAPGGALARSLLHLTATFPTEGIPDGRSESAGGKSLASKEYRLIAIRVAFRVVPKRAIFFTP